MIDPVSAASSILPAGLPGSPAQSVPAPGEPPLPVRETDSATFSPEALAMLEAEQATEGG